MSNLSAVSQPHDFSQMQTADSGGGAMALVINLVFFLLFVLPTLAGFWKIFSKAGQPGWAIMVPFYNAYVFTKVAGKPAWWMLLMLIPGIGPIAALIVLIGVAKKFGKGAGYGVGLGFVPFICAPMLGFSAARYDAAA